MDSDCEDNCFFDGKLITRQSRDLLSDLSKTGFHQKARGLYKGASQVTKNRLTVQLSKKK